jgi:hypothetical protein
MFESSASGNGPLQRLRFEARPRFVLLGAGRQHPGWHWHASPFNLTYSVATDANMLHTVPSLPCAVSADTELYLAFDPLTDKAEAAGVCSRLGMWLHARHDQLFGL